MMGRLSGRCTGTVGSLLLFCFLLASAALIVASSMTIVELFASVASGASFSDEPLVEPSSADDKTAQPLAPSCHELQTLAGKLLSGVGKHVRAEFVTSICASNMSGCQDAHAMSASWLDRWHPHNLRQTRRSAVHQLVVGLQHAAEGVHCPHDPSLWTSESPSGGAQATIAKNGPSNQVLIAGNLRQNEDIMPHFLLRLLETVVALDSRLAFVSIYESGSNDGTQCWLTLLEAMLELLNVPSRIIVGGSLQRKPGQDRIGSAKLGTPPPQL